MVFGSPSLLEFTDMGHIYEVNVQQSAGISSRVSILFSEFTWKTDIITGIDAHFVVIIKAREERKEQDFRFLVEFHRTCTSSRPS